jgi:F-type H+-transporting ATPase subunit a
MAEPAGETGGSAIEIHPMDQFVVGPIFGGDHVGSFLTITNSTLWMAVCIAAISALLILGMRGRALVPNRWQSVAEVLYGFVRGMVMDVMGEEGKRFFPYIFTIFIFILFCNLLALLPGSFTVTSHIAVTGILALAVFFTVVVLGFIKNGVGFLKLFWIDAAPLALRPPLAVIELISFFVRPVSHSIRLAGNMMAGHAVLKVFAGFVPALGAFFILPAILPLAMMVAIFGLETLVAVVQAYIFAILTCIYLNDALHPHH